MTEPLLLITLGHLRRLEKAADILLKKLAEKGELTADFNQLIDAQIACKMSVVAGLTGDEIAEGSGR